MAIQREPLPVDTGRLTELRRKLERREREGRRGVKGCEESCAAIRAEIARIEAGQ